MNNVLESYLVSLGFEVKQPELAKFKQALKEAGTVAEKHTSGIIGQFVKWQSAIVGAFSAVGLATIGMMDKVAQADLGFQLTAQKMFVSTEAARRLTIATKELGYSLSDIAWNPELRQRFTELWGLQGTLEKQRPADFEQTMRHIRDVRFEFAKVSVILQNVAMQLSATLYKALGGDAFLVRLKAWVEWLTSHTPQITQWLTKVLVPILKDAWHVLEDVWKVVKRLIQAFTGDDQLNFDKIGKAIDKGADYMVKFVDAVTSAELVVIDLFKALYDLIHLDFKAFWKNLGLANSDLTPGGATIGGLGILGGILGIGSVGGLAAFAAAIGKTFIKSIVKGMLTELSASGALTGGTEVAAGTAGAGILGGLASFAGVGLAGLIIGIVVKWLDEKIGPIIRGSMGLSEVPAINQAHLFGRKLTSDIASAANRVGIDPAIARGLVSVESGGNPNALGPMTPYGRAIGLTQLLPSTAANLGVDPNNPAENLYGGLYYLHQMLQKYGNNYEQALAAYNWGPGNLDAAIKRHGGVFSQDYLPASVRKYIHDVEGRAGWQVTMTNTIVVPPGTSPETAKQIVSEGTMDALRKQQRMQLLNAGGIYG